MYHLGCTTDAAAWKMSMSTSAAVSSSYCKSARPGVIVIDMIVLAACLNKQLADIDHLGKKEMELLEQQ